MKTNNIQQTSPYSSTQTPFPNLLVWELLKANLRETDELKARLERSEKEKVESLKQDIARLNQRLVKNQMLATLGVKND